MIFSIERGLSGSSSDEGADPRRHGMSLKFPAAPLSETARTASAWPVGLTRACWRLRRQRCNEAGNDMGIISSFDNLTRMSGV